MQVRTLGWLCVVLVACGSFAVGCADDDDAGAGVECEVGQEGACACDDGREGLRQCADNAWAACECSGAAPLEFGEVCPGRGSCASPFECLGGSNGIWICSRRCNTSADCPEESGYCWGFSRSGEALCTPVGHPGYWSGKPCADEPCRGGSVCLDDQQGFGPRCYSSCESDSDCPMEVGEGECWTHEEKGDLCAL